MWLELPTHVAPFSPPKLDVEMSPTVTIDDFVENNSVNTELLSDRSLGNIAGFVES